MLPGSLLLKGIQSLLIVSLSMLSIMSVCVEPGPLKLEATTLICASERHLFSPATIALYSEHNKTGSIVAGAKSSAHLTFVDEYNNTVDNGVDALNISVRSRVPCAGTSVNHMHMHRFH